MWEQSFRLIIVTYYVMCIQTIPSAIFMLRPIPQQAKLLLLEKECISFKNVLN